jgi:hypothetical protein
MPDWDASLINPDVNRFEAVSIGWVLLNGGTFSTRLSALGAGISPDPGNVSAFRAAAGGVSNAGVIRQTEERSTFIATKNAEVYDEAYSDGMVLVITLENDNGQELSFEIPNPDRSIFESDGVTMIQGDAAAAANTPAKTVATLKSATATLINNSFDPANSYEIVRGILRPRKVNVPTGARQLPTIVEPGANDNPGPEPA